MTYRAKPVTQRDGSRLQYSNCLMAAAAVGLDHHTLGAKTSTGSKMRAFSGDTAGGTNTDEIERAWHTGYDEDPTTRDGQPWDKVIQDLGSGRLVMLQVWHATTGGPCLSGSGAYGHGICVAPEVRKHEGRTQWLTADPWCKPAKWVWWDESRLKAGALRWADKVSASGPGIPIRDIAPDLLAGLVSALMAKYTPEHPAEEDPEPPSVGGGGVLFASTKPQQDASGGDVAVNTHANQPVTSARRVALKEGTDFFSDGACTKKLGDLSNDRVVPLLGTAVGTSGRAVVINTSKPYTDGDARPTIVYVKEGAIGDITPEPPPAQGDIEAAVQARDKEWRAWLSGDADAPDK